MCSLRLKDKSEGSNIYESDDKIGKMGVSWKWKDLTPIVFVHPNYEFYKKF